MNIQILKKVENDKTLIKIILENDDDKIETDHLNLYSIYNIQDKINNIINMLDISYFIFGHNYVYEENHINGVKMCKNIL